MKPHAKFIWRTAAAVLTAALLAAPAGAAEFSDASAIANKAAVDTLAELGVISGRPDGSFDPSAPTLRSEMAAMFSLLLEPEGGTYPSAGFPDVAGTWAERFVDHCYSLGIVSGMGDGTFAPQTAVTGTQAAAMILCAAGQDPKSFTGPDWAQAVDAAAKAAGLYEGFSADPALPLTRDGAALLLYNGLDLLRCQNIPLDFSALGLAFQPDGSLLLTDVTGHAVRRMQDGTLTQYSKSAGLGRPWAVAPFLGGWAVSDAEAGKLFLLRDGDIGTINATTSGGSAMKLTYPTGLASDQDGSLYVSDTHSGRICRIDLKGKMTVAASGLNAPMGLCWWNGGLYIAETGSNRILCLKNGKVAVVAGNGQEGYEDGPAASAQFSAPQGVTVSEDGTVYVSDTLNSAIRRIREGRVDTLLARDPSDLTQELLVSPAGLAVRGRRLYVCDSFTTSLLVLLLGSN